MTRPLIDLLAVVLSMVSSAIVTAKPAGDKGRQDAMNSQSDCVKSPVHRSLCMIEAVLENIKATYPNQGGSGISEIRLVATDTYTASIAQEERLDLLTYELALDAKGQVVIKQRSEGTKSARP